MVSCLLSVESEMSVQYCEGIHGVTEYLITCHFLLYLYGGLIFVVVNSK